MAHSIRDASVLSSSRDEIYFRNLQPINANLAPPGLPYRYRVDRDGDVVQPYGVRPSGWGHVQLNAENGYHHHEDNYVPAGPPRYEVSSNYQCDVQQDHRGHLDRRNLQYDRLHQQGQTYQSHEDAYAYTPYSSYPQYTRYQNECYPLRTGHRLSEEHEHGYQGLDADESTHDAGPHHANRIPSWDTHPYQHHEGDFAHAHFAEYHQRYPSSDAARREHRSYDLPRCLSTNAAVRDERNISTHQYDVVQQGQPPYAPHRHRQQGCDEEEGQRVHRLRFTGSSGHSEHYDAPQDSRYRPYPRLGRQHGEYREHMNIRSRDEAHREGTIVHGRSCHNHQDGGRLQVSEGNLRIQSMLLILVHIEASGAQS
jgi:hypothetical protein